MARHLIIEIKLMFVGGRRLVVTVNGLLKTHASADVGSSQSSSKQK